MGAFVTSAVLKRAVLGLALSMPAPEQRSPQMAEMVQRYSASIAPKGRSYSPHQTRKWSHLNDPFNPDVRFAALLEKLGSSHSAAYKPSETNRSDRTTHTRSRVYGDAPDEVKAACAHLIVQCGRAMSPPMTDNEIRCALAICYIESGFNPDAAAGTTSASGLGQFIDATRREQAKRYRVEFANENPFDVHSNAELLCHWCRYLHTVARERKQRDPSLAHVSVGAVVYALHHEGPRAPRLEKALAITRQHKLDELTRRFSLAE